MIESFPGVFSPLPNFALLSSRVAIEFCRVLLRVAGTPTAQLQRHMVFQMNIIFRRTIVFPAVAVVLGVQFANAALPMTGAYVPELQVVDTLLQNFMIGKPIPGGTIAITHNHELIYERGIGYSDTAHSVPMQETDLMRLASVSKPVTASAIQQLVKDGKLDLNAKVFNISGNGGLLNITPYNGILGDSRLRDITVNELLQHEGGWNRDTAGDLAFKDVQIAAQDGAAESSGDRQYGPIYFEPTAAIHAGHNVELLEHRLYVFGHGGRGDVGTRLRELCGQ